MKILTALSAMFDLWAAESRAGIRLIEATEASVFETQLRYVTRNEEERSNLREIAILAGKMGLRAEDLEPMLRSYYRAKDDRLRTADLPPYNVPPESEKVMQAQRVHLSTVHTRLPRVPTSTCHVCQEFHAWAAMK